jgi:hypothetical protein
MGWRDFIGCVGVAALVTLGCPPPAHAAGTATVTPAPLACNPVRVQSCALPYPSDLFAVTDPASPTGIRLHVDDAILSPEVLAQIPPAMHPSAIFDGQDGFSAAGPILFELDAPPDPTTLPADGGDAVVVFDRTTGERVDVMAEFDTQALKAPTPGHVVRVWPRTRFEFGGKYVAALTTGLRRFDATAYERSAGFAAAVSGADPALGAHYRPIMSFLAARGLPAESVVSAVDFTVRSEASATEPLRRMAAKAYAAPHPVRELKVIGPILPGMGAIVTGQVQLTDFRGDDGGIDWSPAAPGRPLWTDFILTIPAQARHTPAPVAIYGHGLTVSKETLLAVAFTNAKHGVATIAIDQPNHGKRAWTEGGPLRPDGGVASLANLPRLIAIVVQSSIDMVSVLRAVETSLADIDVVPWLPRKNGAAVAADRRGDLDPSRIVYEGTSMGGVLGSAFSAIAPGLDGSLLQVGGVGIMHILTSSSVWDNIGLDQVMPEGATGAELAVAVAGIQHVMDPGDGINFAHFYRHPPPGLAARPVLLLYGAGDTIVPNFASEALTDIAGLPRFGPCFDPDTNFEVDCSPPLPPGPINGYGSRAEARPPSAPVGVWDFAAHLAFARPEPMRIFDAWLAGVLAG